MVVHWAGEKSKVIVALARDSTGSTGPKTSSVNAPRWFCWPHVHTGPGADRLCALPVQVYVSYDYGTTFTQVSDKFQLPEGRAHEDQAPVISQFYHSPADNKRVGTNAQMRLAAPAANGFCSASSVSLCGLQQRVPVEHL